MTSNKIYNFSTNNKGNEIVKVLLTSFNSIINSNQDLQPKIKRKLRFRRAAMEELGTISSGKDVSTETRAKIIHILIFPLTM